MSIHRRPTSNGDVRYVVRWRDPRPRERTFRRQADAERFERTVRHQVDTGTYRDPALGRITFRAWHDRWWPTVEQSDRSPTTVTNYEIILKRHVLPYLGDRRLGDLRRIHFEEWLATLRESGLSSSTLHLARTTAGMVLSSAVDSGVIPANPIAGIRMVKGSSKTKQALTAEQVEALADAIDPWWRPLLLTLAYCGLRPGEAAALRRRHLDRAGRLTIEAAVTEHRGKLVEQSTKTRRSRVVRVPASVLLELQAHLEANVVDDPEALIFAQPGGHVLRLSNWRHHVWIPTAAKADLPEWATPYVLRHTAASLMAQQGVPVATAAAALGHDPAVFLRTYAHLYPGDLEAAAGAMETARRGGQKARDSSVRRSSRGDIAGMNNGRTDLSG